MIQHPEVRPIATDHFNKSFQSSRFMAILMPRSTT